MLTRWRPWDRLALRQRPGTFGSQTHGTTDPAVHDGGEFVLAWGSYVDTKGDPRRGAQSPRGFTDREVWRLVLTDCCTLPTRGTSGLWCTTRPAGMCVSGAMPGQGRRNSMSRLGSRSTAGTWCTSRIRATRARAGVRCPGEESTVVGSDDLGGGGQAGAVSGLGPFGECVHHESDHKVVGEVLVRRAPRGGGRECGGRASLLEPLGVAVSPRGNRVYVADAALGNVLDLGAVVERAGVEESEALGQHTR